MSRKVLISREIEKRYSCLKFKILRNFLMIFQMSNIDQNFHINHQKCTFWNMLSIIKNVNNVSYDFWYNDIRKDNPHAN